MKHKTRYKSSW